MGRTKRKYSSFIIKYKRSFKKPLFEVGNVMNIGFSNDSFYEEFKILYSYLWADICSKFSEYNRMDEGLVKKGFKKRYFFPSPIIFLKDISNHVINTTRNNQSKSDYIFSEEERIKKRKNLLINCEEKIKANQNKQNNNLKYIQEVKPKYSNYFIDEYFKLKHQNTQDVTSRYIILLEASKYKCKETIQFLHKVNASERNFNLRQFAFRSLQKFGVKEVRLRKNRKGKKKTGDSLIPYKIETPTELLKHIYISQLEKEKTYDLFLSHSSLDQDLILKLKTALNASNLNIYVDWINDQEGLKRELTNVDTAEVIIQRLKSCKALLFIYTEDSLKSFWTPWEIGYFHSLKGKICIYFSENIDKAKVPAFINIYPIVIIENGNFVITENELKQNLSKWIAT